MITTHYISTTWLMRQSKKSTQHTERAEREREREREESGQRKRNGGGAVESLCDDKLRWTQVARKTAAEVLLTNHDLAPFPFLSASSLSASSFPLFFSCVSMFYQLVVNDWFVLMEGVAVTSAGQGSRVFFISFYAISVLTVLSACTEFIVAAYFSLKPAAANAAAGGGASGDDTKRRRKAQMEAGRRRRMEQAMLAHARAHEAPTEEAARAIEEATAAEAHPSPNATPRTLADHMPISPLQRV